MWHTRRRWRLDPVETPAVLLTNLVSRTWCPCQGFQVEGTPYLFLNDATSPDGAQEWAVVLGEGEAFPQVESITFSWCQPFQAREYIDRALAGGYVEVYDLIDPRQIETPEEHADCPHC